MIRSRIRSHSKRRRSSTIKLRRRIIVIEALIWVIYRNLLGMIRWRGWFRQRVLVQVWKVLGKSFRSHRRSGWVKTRCIQEVIVILKRIRSRSSRRMFRSRWPLIFFGFLFRRRLHTRRRTNWDWMKLEIAAFERSRVHLRIEKHRWDLALPFTPFRNIRRGIRRWRIRRWVQLRVNMKFRIITFKSPRSFFYLLIHFKEDKNE